jgi:hypothetical protein
VRLHLKENTMTDAPAVNLYRVGPRQLRALILDCLYAGLVPFIRGSSGIGKSRITGSVGDELNLWMIDHRLSTSEPTDMSGLPHFNNNRARFAPFEELFPLTNTPIPAGKDGWIIFFDEMNSAPKAVQAACYKIILDRMVGQHRLHENVVMVCAGNLDTDRAITTTIGTAMQSRLVHLELEVVFQEWLEDVALAENYDSRIIAFLNQYPSLLMDFNPDHKDRTFCCPRTWEFLNRLIKGKVVTESKTPLYAGTISSHVAATFVQFTRIFDNLITVREIMNDPENCPLSNDNSIRWATISHMMEMIDEKNFEGMATYANRFPLPFKIIFYRSVLIRNPKLKNHPSYGKAQAELSRYIFTN